MFDRIRSRIDGYEEETIKIQKAITAMPALSPENGGDGEAKKAEWLESYIRDEIGISEIEHYDAPDERVSGGMRPNFIARLKGKSHARTVWIMSHMDVVPPGDVGKWESDPWAIKVADGKIYGRGTEDNQQGIVSSLLTAKAFRDEGIQPEFDLGLILVADEETGNDFGIKYLLKNHRELFRENDYYIIPDSGNSDGTVVEIAEKSILWFKLVVLGKSTHGSTPDLGINAHKAASHLVVKLDQLYKLFDKSDPVFDPPISTFEPTKREANVPNVNTIPGEEVFYLDCRILPDYDLQVIKKEAQKICAEISTEFNVKIDLSFPQELQAPAPTPVDAPVVKAVERAITEIRKVEPKPMGIGGGTVAAYFRDAGLPSVVWATQDETLHGPNEYVKIENILQDAKVFAHIALQP